MGKRDRKYYEWLFESYPDVVDLQMLRKMLGGISESVIRVKLQNSTIKHFKMDGKKYMIPKIYVVDYVLSDDYQNYKHMLKAQI